MTQQDLLYLMRKPQLDDLATNEYGDRAYGAINPEGQAFAAAYEQAKARSEHPRYLAPGITYNGRSGNIDAPELLDEQIFKPLEAAFRPDSTRDLALQAQIAHQRELERQTDERHKMMAVNLASLQADREARREALLNKPPEMDTVTDVYPAVGEVAAIPAREEGKWNPFVENRMIPEVPAIPAQPERRVVRKVPRGTAPVTLPTAPVAAGRYIITPSGDLQLAR